MEENLKKKKNTGFKVTIAILSILLVLASGAATYLYLNKDNKSSIQNCSNLEKQDKNKYEKNTAKEISKGFYNNKALNSTGKTYSLVSNNGKKGFNISFDQEGKTMEFYVKRCQINFTYSLGWTTVNEQTCTFEEHNFEKVQTEPFSKRVVEILDGEFGQDTTNETLLFLMEDGTIEYIPLKKAFTNINNGIKSYGTIPNISDIVKLYQVSAIQGNTGNYVTVLAQNSDGDYYDLNEALSNLW